MGVALARLLGMCFYPGMSSNLQEPLSPEVCTGILLAEYRALYDLALFRLASLDRRVPLTGSALAAALGAALVLPLAAKIFILIAHPLALVWFLRTTINHARSFEDVIRRIEQIEGQLNQIAGHQLLRFQSHHPSRGKATGGRTGQETISAVLIASGLILLGCAGLTPSLVDVDAAVRGGLLAYFGFIAIYLAQTSIRLHRYRYSAQPG